MNKKYVIRFVTGKYLDVLYIDLHENALHQLFFLLSHFDIHFIIFSNITHKCIHLNAK